MITDSEQFLSDSAVEKLLTLTEPKKTLEGTGYGGADPVIWASTKNYRYATPGCRLAIAPELLLELEEAAPVVVLEREQIDATFSTPFSARNYTQVPLFANFGVVPLSFVVPEGYRLWLEAYALNLFPDQSNELNYFWQILINGQDILNKGRPTLQPGRPVQTAEYVTIGRDKDSMILVQPGATVQISVRAINSLGASDYVSGALIGYLEGIFQ